MQHPTIPPDEVKRLEVLRRYGILDTAPELAFDRLSRLGARVFQAPIVLVSLIDQTRQWYKSCYGIDVKETGRDVSFCAHAILTDDPLVILDASADPRFYDNPLVTGEPHVRFYAGAPLIAPDGSRIGAFCAVDQSPRREFTRDQVEMLRDFAAIVMEELELRRTARDLAETEKALRTSEDRFNAFMDHSPALAFIKDTDGRMLYVNSACERIWSRKACDWVGKTDAELWPPDVAERIRKSDLEVLRDRTILTVVEEAPVTQSDLHQFLTFKFPFTDESGVTFLGAMAVDVTDRLKLEEQLREQTRRANEASRLKSEFLANMSHELRTPLNGIIGFSELLADGKGGELTAKQQRFIGNILLSSRHLLHLINDLLDLAKIEAGKLELDPRAVSASSLVSEVADSMRSLADLKHITLSMHVDSEAEHLFVDPARFKQVVYNYVSNAIKFTPDNGSVTVKVTSDSNRSVRLDVCDTGIGIDAVNLPRLFQQFHQLDTGAAKRYAGTGLGLALVKRLVEQHGGYVDVKSELDAGSCFSAVFPAASAESGIS